MRLLLVLALSLFSVSAFAGVKFHFVSGIGNVSGSCFDTPEDACASLYNRNQGFYYITRTNANGSCSFQYPNSTLWENWGRAATTCDTACPEGQSRNDRGICAVPEPEPDPDDIGPEDCVERGMAIEGASIWSRSEGCKARPIELPPFESECTSGDNFCTSKLPDVNNGEWNCGMFNGVETCVQSSSTSSSTGVGSGSKPIGTTTATDPNKTITETKTTTSADGSKTTTTTTTKTTETTTTTEPNLYGSNAPLGTGQSLDPGTGPAAPYVCEDGRLAANMLSCDSTKTCPAGHYLAYGVCLALPTKTTVVDTTTTTTETTVRDNVTGETETTTETGTETKAGEDECNPTTSYCGGGFGEFDVYKTDDGLSYENILMNFQDRINSAPIKQGIESFFSFESTGQCPTWSAEIGMGFPPINFNFFCSDMIPWGIISGVLFVVSLLFAVRIALT